MSIRVHKRLGYGVTDLKHEPDGKYAVRMLDPRVSFALLRESDLAESLTLEDILVWCLVHETELKTRLAAEGWSASYFWCITEGIKDQIGRSFGGLYELVTWGDEYKDPATLLIQAPDQYEKCSRHDDLMDYYEETEPDYSIRSRTTPLWTHEKSGRIGIHPYDGTMIRIRIPQIEAIEALVKCPHDAEEILRAARHRDRVMVDVRPTDPTAVTFLDGGRYNELVGRWSPNRPATLHDELVLRHFQEDWRPTVAPGVIALLAYLDAQPEKIFPDAFGPNGILNSLRPMIYVWWS